VAILYVGSTRWTAVTAWAASTAYTVGDLRRQLAGVAAGSERVFRCTTAGTSGGTEPTWVITKGATTTSGGAVFTEVTGDEAFNSPNNFAAPHARLRHAFSWGAAGDTFYVSQAHAATEAAAVTLTSPGTAASPCIVLCIDDAQATATLTTGATETVTSTNSLNFAGFCNSDGVGYRGGSSGTAVLQFISPLPWYWWISNGHLRGLGTTGANGIIVGGTASTNDDMGLELNNVTVQTGAAGRSILIRANLKWRNTANAVDGTLPTNLFVCAVAFPGRVELRGVDLSALGVGRTLVDISAASSSKFLFLDCKLGALDAITTGANPGQGGTEVDVINSDSADTNFRYSRHRYQGTVTHETTVIRTGGASDGVTGFSRVLISSANSKFFAPQQGVWTYFWNSTVGSPVTCAMEVVNDGTILTDAQAWVEAEAVTTSGFPLGGFATDRAANILSTPANQTTSSEPWTTTGLGAPVFQVLSTTITPLEIGWIRMRTCLARPSTTLYVCPKVLANSTQYMTESGDIVNVAAGGGGGGSPSAYAFC